VKNAHASGPPASFSGVAFFDLDLTLLDVNTASLWIKREYREKNISRMFFLKSATWVGLYQLGFARMEDVIEKAVLLVEGLHEEEIRERTFRFWEEEVKMRFRAGASAAIQAHREAGHACVLLTSSSPYLSRPVAELLAFDGILCNRFEVIDGRFTGRAEKPLCYGEGKLVHANAWLQEHKLTLEQSAFYTDSFSDLPVLDAVGTPVCVHPDPRLRRQAERRGWAVQMWGNA